MPHALPRRTRRLALAGAVLAVAAVPVAVIGPVLAGTGPTVALNSHQDVSRPLRELAGAAPAPAATRMSPPAVNFAGMSLGAQHVGAPTDANGAIGATAYVQSMNTQYAVYSRTGKLLLGPVKTNTLWKGFGGPCETHNDGDPVVLYDHLANRWVQSQFALPGSPPFYQCVAVSTSGDPTGTWYRYAFATSRTDWNDYAKLSVWPDGYYLSANLFDGIVGGTDGRAAIVFERAKMLQGKPARLIVKHLPDVSNEPQLLPADLDGAKLPPAGAPDPYAGVDEIHHSIVLYRFHTDWGTPSKSTFTGPVTLSAAPYSTLDGCDPCAPQPGTSTRLTTLPGLSMFRLAYRNFGDHEALVFNHAVDADPGKAVRPGIRWYEIRGVSGTPKLFQQGTFAPDTDSRFDASVAMDRFGDLAAGYTVSGTHTFPSIRYAGRLPTDPAGTLARGEASIVAGTGSQTSPRWGDYSDLTLDPLDDCTFWYTNVYLAKTGTTRNSRIAAFRFPACQAAHALDESTQ